MTALSYLLQLLHQSSQEKEVDEKIFAEFLNLPKMESMLQQLINWEAETLAEWDIFLQIMSNEKTKSDSKVFVFELDPRIEAKVEDLFSTSSILKETLVLPPATIGKNYRYFFDFQTQGLEDAKEYEMQGLEDAGLEWDTDASTIYGIPHTEGEFDCFVKYKLFHHSEKQPYQYKKIFLTVLNIPEIKKTKNIPSDEDEKYWKPDEMKSLIVEGEKRVFAASRRGGLHASEGEIRTDDFGIFYDKNTKWYIMAVASGAEDAKFGRKGAQIAAKNGLTFLANKIRDTHLHMEQTILSFIENPTETKSLGKMLHDLLGGAILETSHLIEEEANENEASYIEYATSATILIMKQLPQGWAIASLGIGDNSLVLFQAEEVKTLYALTNFSKEDIMQISILKDLSKRLSFQLLADFDALILSSKGIKSVFETSENAMYSQQKWREIWQELKIKMRLEREEPESSLLYLADWLEENPDENDSTIILIS